jgi:hypothetical protein
MILSEEFLSGVPEAEGIVRNLLDLYSQHNVETIVETAFKTPKEAVYMENLLGVNSNGDVCEATTANQEDDQKLTSVKAALHPSASMAVEASANTVPSRKSARLAK